MSDERSNEELRQATQDYLQREGMQFRPSTDSWVRGGRGMTVAEVKNLACYELSASKNRIEIMLAKISDTARSTAVTAIEDWLHKIESRPTDDAELDKFLRLLEHPDTTEIEHRAHLLTMKHWMWQVKNAILGMDVVWQVTPIFWSAEEGTGKSRNVKRLIKPLDTFSRSVTVDELNEKFSGRLFAGCLIALFDEFAGADKADANALKSILTGKPFDRRAMHSESGFYSENRLSCIGTSNLAPPHGFVNESGARRFWSIRCAAPTGDAAQARFDALDEIRVERLWAAVSVDDEPPHETIPLEVRAYMDQTREENLRTHTAIQQFIAEMIEPRIGHELPMGDFARAFKSYCASTNQKFPSGGYRQLAKRLNEMNIRTVNEHGYYRVRGHILRGDGLRVVGGN